MDWKIMQVVILAGGLGTRLSELTETIPKPMVPIGSEPVLVHIMRHYAAFGHKDFVIALGYKGHKIKEYFSNLSIYNSDIEIDFLSKDISIMRSGNLDWKVKLVDTGENTATGGRLLALEKYLSDEFLLTYGDGVSDVNLESLIKHHQKEKGLATVTAVRPPARFGSLVIAGSTVTEFSEKNPLHEGWINGGFFCLSKKVLGYIAGSDSALEGAPMHLLAKDGHLKAYLHEGFWHPMDTLRDKRFLDELWNKGDAPWRVD